MKAFRSMPLLAALLVAPAMRAGAQGECKIDYGKPKEIKDAEGALKRYELVGQPEDKKKNYIKAVTLLTREPEKLQVNAAGRNMLLGRALIDLATLPDMAPIVKRGDVGFVTDSTANIDLIAAGDSALDALEAELPTCHDDTEEYRRKAYAQVVQQAVDLYNNHQIDSAEVLARRALMVYDNYKLAYVAYQILGNALQSKDDYAGAIDAFKKQVTLMKGDTALVDERKSTVMLVSQLMTAAGQQLEGEARKKAMADAVVFLQDYLKEDPTDTKIQSAIARAQLLSGDEEAAKRLFDDMLNNPGKYTDLQLLEAGVTAAQGEKQDIAATLFEAALKKNPYSRDGLFNLAATYDALGQSAKMPPVLQKLVEIDPENPENYKLWARYWQARAKELKPPPDAKTVTDADKKAWDDAQAQLLASFTRFSDAKVKVTFSLFSHDEGTHVLGGTVENLSDADANYTLKFDFLDATGAVLDSKQVDVAAVPAKGAKPFRVEVSQKPGVVAFKYAPLP